MSAFTAAPVLPPLALAAYLVCVAGAGVLANVAVVAALFRRERNAFHVIVMQLAVSDALLLCGAAGFETWSRNEGTWTFGGAACVAHLGCEAFATAASAYFAVTLALHALATARLEDAASAAGSRARRARDDDSDAEMRSSRRSLVADDSSTPPRTMSVDYRIANTSLPVAVPIVFVWVLAASLSVPPLALGATVRHDGGATECSFADPSHRLHAQALLAAFGLFVPTFLLTTAGALAACRLRGGSRKRADGEAVPALVLSLCLAAVFVTLCAPRSALAAYRQYSALDVRLPSHVGAPAAPPTVTLALSCLNYSAALLRPLMCIIVFPDLRRSFSFRGRPRDV